MVRINKFICALSIMMCAGCSTTYKTDKLISKILLPVNITAAYFSSVAIHELGHATPAWIAGAKRVDITVWPTKEDGEWHAGFTRAHIELEGSEEVAFHAMGPAFQYFGHLASRGLLESNKIPRLLQPFLGWFDLFNVIGYYSHVLDGVIRVNEHSDLVKTEPWISYVMLGGGIAIDLIDILFIDSGFAKRFKVLFGEEFYEDKNSNRLSIISSPNFLGIRFEW